MEPLFHLNLEDVDVLLPVMKERLMLQDEDAQMSIVARISAFFDGKTVAEREALLFKLIKFDIISTLLVELQTPNDRLLPNILDLLSLVSGYPIFYEDHVAMDAVDSMLKLAYCTSKSHAEETKLLEKLILTISDILRRAVEFGKELEMVCVPQQILLLLKLLIIENSSCNKLRFPATKLLNIVLRHATLDEDYDEVIVFHLCHEALNSMREIVEYSDDDTSIAQAAIALCCTCASATRFCFVDHDECYENLDRRIRCKDALTRAIYATTINTIVPYVKSSEVSQTEGFGFHMDFVTSLNNLYKLRSCIHDNLSNHLTANGYLKYFLRLTVELPEKARRSTCILLSRILTTLARNTMSLERWHDGITGFSNLLYHGLLNLPKDPRIWINVIARENGGSGVALMVLLYFDFHGTRDKDMISLEALIARVLKLPESEPIVVQILKPLWFLFAIASISHNSANSHDDYVSAVKRLSAALLRSKLNDCYTHHIDLLRYCLECPDIPRELRCKTMDLWLIESEGDVKPLLNLNCDKVVRHCLLMVVQSGYPESLIELAVKGIRELMKVDNAKEIAEIAWQMLPSLLSSYRPFKDEHIKAVLELANVSAPHLLPLNAIKRCADGVVNIILTPETDLKLKTLAVMQAYILLETSLSRKMFKVLGEYVNTPALLEELCNEGFSKKNLELSAVCMKLLALIVHSQSQSSIQCRRALIINVKKFTDLLINTKDSPHAWINGTQFLLELLIQDTSAPSIKLEISSRTEDLKGLVNLYETLHLIVHGKGNPAERDLVYKCLSANLKFCHRNVETLMYHVCTSMSNYVLVLSTLNSSRIVSCDFLDFLATWLCYRRRHCNVEGSWHSRSLCKTPFEEMLDNVKQYMNSIDSTKFDDVHYKLQYAVSILLLSY